MVIDLQVGEARVGQDRPAPRALLIPIVRRGGPTTVAIALLAAIAARRYLALVNAGPDPDGFFAFFADELAEPLRAIAPAR